MFSHVITFEFLLLFQVRASSYCFYIGIWLASYSRILLPHPYHCTIICLITSLFMAFGSNLHISSVIGILHHFNDTLIHSSFYLYSWLAIMALLILDNSSLMIFLTPTILPWTLISSLSCQLLYTIRFISSNLMPPVTKFKQFFLMMTLSGFYDCFYDDLYPINSSPGC